MPQQKIQQTLILIKPDGMRRALAGEIISRIERKGLDILALRMLRFDDDLVASHYAEHIGKPFFQRLKDFVMSGPVIAMVVSGDQAIAVMRIMMGPTKFTEATPGSIRGDYALHVTENLIHGSDSEQSAAREIPLYFKPEQLFQK